jgi:putative ABC transport system permease protein
MKTLLQDMRFGLRVLLKNPGFAAVAVITLALGIGANTAIFSVVYGVVLKRLPYKDADRIVVANISPLDYRDVKEANQVFDQMAIWASNRYNLSINHDTTQVTGAIVSPELIPMLGSTMLGRAWTPEEDTQLLVVISHDLWHNRLGGDPNVIGKTLSLYGEVHTIIGVMPPEFEYPNSEFKLWVPFGSAMAKTPQQAQNRQLRIFRAVARLKPGVTPAQMQAEVDTISQRLQQQFPDTNAGIRITFTPIYQRIVGDVSRALLVLLGTVGFVLLIACANVANLMLARTAAREREIAIRTALGASSRRLIRQLLTESLLLALFGGILGLLLAMWGIDLLPKLNPENLPRLTTIGINLPVLLFTLGISFLTGTLFGLAPVWQMVRANINQSLKEGGRGTEGKAKGKRLRSALVVVEVALSLVVLVGAGLLLKSLVQLLRVDPGLVSENLMTANVVFVQFKDPQRRVIIQREILNRISQIPGVQVAGGGTALPPAIAQRGTRFAVQGLPNDNPGDRSSNFIAVSPEYFRALGTPVIEGRAFTERDNSESARVVVISRTLARNLFQNESAIGKRLQLINPEQSNEWREIVGVVGDVRYSGLDDSNVPTVYTPFAQTPFIWNYLMIRTSIAPETLTQSVRQAINSVDPSLEAADFQTMDQLLTASVAQPRFYTLLLGGFAILALLLAAVGIYGVMAYTVSQRTQEIGVRMALGARQWNVLMLVLQQGMILTFLGIGLGLIAAFWLMRLMRNLLFEVRVTDFYTFAVISFLLAVISLLACYIPARRAMKVDPIVALRYE